MERIVENRTEEITQQNEQITTQNKHIEKQQTELQIKVDELTVRDRDITDSINYARRIQASVLPPKSDVISLFPKSFIFFRPKDVLSGDFYWVHKLEKTNPDGSIEERKLIAAVDCTGHGVPGALMAIIGNNLLNHAVGEYLCKTPGRILHILEEGLKSAMRSENEVKQPDGMDLALLAYNDKTRILEYAGAHNPLFLIRNRELKIYNGNKYSIGGNMKRFNMKKEFINHTIEILPEDKVYIFSDGFADQFGGAKGRKFMAKRFRELLVTISNLPMDKQLSVVEKTFDNWKKDYAQIDDVLIIGIEF